MFATEGQTYGNGVVHLALPEDIASIDIVSSNVLAAKEAEVVMGIPPSEFANLASTTITASEARTILQDIGVSMPSYVTRSGGQFDQVLEGLPRLTSTQIQQFVERAQRISGGR
ncbi:hypothetical protein ACQZ6F_31805 [Rhizobium sp. A22-96]